MKRQTYLERMQLLDEVDDLYWYFIELHKMASSHENFKQEEYNKYLQILVKAIQDVKL